MVLSALELAETPHSYVESALLSTLQSAYYFTVVVPSLCPSHV